MSDADVVGGVPARIVGSGFSTLERFFADPANHDAIASNGPLEGRVGLRFAMLCSGVGGVSIHSTADRMVLLGVGFSLRGAVITALCKVTCDDGVKRAEVDRCLSLLV